MTNPNLPELGGWRSRQELEALQKARLPAVLQRAYQAKYYRDHLPENVLDVPWSEIPLTRKSDLTYAYPFGFLAGDLRQVATYHESSGTTGKPTPSYLSDGDWEDIGSRFARIAVDMNADDMVLVKTPYSMLPTAFQMHKAARLRGATVVPASNRSWMMPFTKVVRLLSELPISVVWCMPTEVLLWAAAARQAGLDPARDFPSLRGFVLAGEPMSEVKRRRIEEIWGGVKVFQDYGSTETGCLAGECAHRSMHLWCDRLLCEVRDPETGAIQTEGTGQLVITTLYREAMPLIRYVLEDTVSIVYRPCACGWELPSVRVLGRTGTDLVVAGHSFYPVQIDEAVHSLAREYEVLFWRALHSADELMVEIEAPVQHRARACDELGALLQKSLGFAPKVRAVAPGTIVPVSDLTEVSKPVKPRFVFSVEEGFPQTFRW